MDKTEVGVRERRAAVQTALADATRPAAAAPQAALPSHIKLATDWRDYRAGRVLAVTRDLLPTLDAAGIAYTEATSRERCIAGFAD